MAKRPSAKPLKASQPVRRETYVAAKLGDAKKPDSFRNCLSCVNFGSCKDPKKSFKHLCSKWVEMPQLDDPSKGILDLVRSGDVEPRRKPVKGEKKAPRRLTEAVEEAVNSKLPIPPDFTLGDEDYPEAGNFWQWLSKPEFAEGSFTPYPKQFELLMTLEGCYCPRCSDPKLMGGRVPVDYNFDNLLDRIQLLDRGVCPKCKARKSSLVRKGELNDPYTLLGIIGQRAGKSATVMAYEAYNIHRFLKVPNPQQLYGTMKSQLLTGTYTALTLPQAKQNLWSHLDGYFSATEWFREYHRFLSNKAAETGIERLHKFGELSVAYEHKGLFFGVEAPNKRSMRGRSRLSGIIDEGSWFPFGTDNEGNERMTGEEVFTALFNSMATIVTAHENLLAKGYDFVPKPLIGTVSSPVDVNDLVMKMQRQAKGSRTIYSFKFATWEFNPTLKRNSALIDQAYRTDAVKAERDFGANPPLSSSGWVVGTTNVFPNFVGETNLMRIKQAKLKSKFNSNVKDAKAKAFRTGARLEGPEEQQAEFGRVLCLDAGLVNNSFAIAVAHKDEETGQVVLEALGEIMPTRDAPISYEKLYADVLSPLCEIYGIQAVVSDHWQSESTLDRLEQDHNVQRFSHKLKYKHFTDAKSAFLDRQIILPSLEDGMSEETAIFDTALEYPKRFVGKPAAHLFYQILTVKDIIGKEVTKGNGSTDDLFRCMILAHWALNEPEVLEALAEPSNDTPFESSDIGITISGTAGGVSGNQYGIVSSMGKGGGIRHAVMEGKGGRDLGVVGSAGRR
jgi:hypothetical protein